jgi:hypothetical protein
MRQRLSHQPMMLISEASPVRLAGLARSRAAGTCRNSMADRPQNSRGWERAAVRFVQHLKVLFAGRTIALPTAVVTLPTKACWQAKTPAADAVVSR